MQSIVSPYLIKFNRYVRSVLLFIIPVLFCTAFEREIMYTLRVLAVWVFFGIFTNLCLVLLSLFAGSLVPKLLF